MHILLDGHWLYNLSVLQSNTGLAKKPYIVADFLSHKYEEEGPSELQTQRCHQKVVSVPANIKWGGL